MSYNFHIGQDVVTLLNHSCGCFKKDEVVNIKGLKISNCCGIVLVDIGIKCTVKEYPIYIDKCVCGFKEISKDSVWWFSEECFAPLDSITDISELKEILEQPIFTAYKFINNEK